VEPLTNYMVGRVQKDFNEGKTIVGAIFTGTSRDLDENLDDFMHKSAYSGGIDFTRYFKDKKWMFNVNTAFSQVKGTTDAIDHTQKSSARYFQRPDKDYAMYDPTRTSLSGAGGRVQINKLDGHLNFMTSVLWKTPGFEINDLGYLQQADRIMPLIWAGYSQWEPKGIYRRYNVNADIWTIYNFGGVRVQTGFEANVIMTFRNFWNAWIYGNIQTDARDASLLRGGPTILTPGRRSINGGFSTDSRKKLELEFWGNYNKGFENNLENLSFGSGLTWKPTNYLRISLNPQFSRSFTELQYVTETNMGDDARYIFASIDRKTINTSLRINLNLSPDLTVQYWGPPFIASGRYHDYKYITDPMAEKFTNRFHTYSAGEITRLDGSADIDENLDGIVDYTFDTGDFNVQEFLSNLVVRWEYSPGSSLYLVWSQTRSGFNPSGQMEYLDDLGNLFSRSLFHDDDDYRMKNVFLIKFSYRFGLN